MQICPLGAVIRRSLVIGEKIQLLLVMLLLLLRLLKLLRELLLLLLLKLLREKGAALLKGLRLRLK